MRFRGVTPAQQRVLGLVAMGEDGGHPPQTLEALERKGLLVGQNQTTPGRASVRIRRYHVPLPVHAEWCAWRAEHYPDEE